jgi:hypothetical protein
LRDPDGTIHMGGTILEKPMEMNTGALVPKLIDHIDDDPVSNGGRYVRERPLVVNADDRTWKRIVGVGGDPGNAPVVCNGRGVRREAEEKRKEER